MTVFASPLTECNLACEYCYENPTRFVDSEAHSVSYDFDEVKDRFTSYAHKTEGQFALHGGEPTLMNDEHIEEIFKFIAEETNDQPSFQTNGTLITDALVDILKKYDVTVGLSMDGPEELNSLRLAKTGTTEDTERTTQRTHENLTRLIEEEIDVGIIVVLSTANAGTDEKLNKLLEWMDWLTENGVTGHFNPAIPYPGTNDEDVSLTRERIKEVYIRTWEWMKEEEYRSWGPIANFVSSFYGHELYSCTDRKCDIYNTESGKHVIADGEESGCGRTWDVVSDGVRFMQGESANNERDNTNERYEILQQTPGPYTQEVQVGEIPDQGGCKGCPYWSICHGGCPAQGLDNNYRKRTRTCEGRRAVFEKIESDIRASVPNVRLVTDSSWEIDSGVLSMGGLLDIHPFADTEPVKHPNDDGARPVESVIVDDLNRLEDEIERRDNRSHLHELLVEFVDEYGDENVTVDWERRVVDANIN